MDISKELQNFIEQNIDIIERNTTESWKEVYEKLPPDITGTFTETMLSVSVDPAEILGYIPNNYLYNSNRKDYTIPNNVDSIGRHAFCLCNSLTKILIPEGVTTIGYEAFYICDSLKEIAIPNSVTSIGNYAFASCHSLKKITIPDSVTALGSSVFCNCTSLTEISISDNVPSISKYAFEGCVSLDKLVIPTSVKIIGACAFAYCRSLTEIIYQGTKNEAFTILGVSDDWRNYSNIKQIICKDGVIEL